MAHASHRQTTAAANDDAEEDEDEELVVPFVLWNEPPRVQVSCLHVLHLPRSQPSSQNATNGHGVVLGDPEQDVHADEDKYEVCVFVGTIDGFVLYWRFDQGVDHVAQVNLLVPRHGSTLSASLLTHAQALGGGGGSSEPPRTNGSIQEIISGIDEWGQSMMVALTRPGALTKWLLPNGLCCFASSDLAKQLAPLKGMKMFCNRRFAMVFGEESRMMALDTWKMQLLFCVDTAQEQVRRGIAVAELRFGWSGVSAKQSSSYASSSSAASAGSSVGGGTSTVGSMANDGSTTFASNAGLASPSHKSSSFGTLASPLAKTASMSSFASQSTAPTGFGSSSWASTSAASLIWDSLVISLGAEGLLKCFLWAKPRGSQTTANPSSQATLAAPSSSPVGTSAFYHWKLESCWIISWADDTEDITCSQSTSLRDGDNMNPQTALMRSIKSSYFPIALEISPESSLVLIIWRTRWAVLKRKWLCSITGSNKASNYAVHKAKEAPGTCRIHPATFVGQRGEDKNPEEEDPDALGVCWVGGSFLTESELLLWTNTGHVFQFSLCHAQSTLTPCGQLFIFTKDEDQLVPRSYFKTLYAIKSVQFLAYLKQCLCCGRGHAKKNSWISLLETDHALHRDGVRWNSSGFTSCSMLSQDGQSNSSANGGERNHLRLVHSCRHGSIGCWQKLFVGGVGSRRKSSGVYFALGNVGLYDKIKFHSLLPPAALRTESDLHGKEDTSKTSSRLSVSHLIIGREQSRASFTMDANDTLCRGRHTCSSVNSVSSVTSFPWKSSYPNANFERNVAAKSSNATNSPDPILVASNSMQSIPLQQTTTATGLPGSDVFRHLNDVPVLVRGFGDGRLEFHLLQNGANNHISGQAASTITACHHGPITCIAHCNWRTKRRTTQQNPPGSHSLWRTGGSSVNLTQRRGTDGPVAFKTMPPLSNKQKTWKRATADIDSYLAHERNMFYRAGGVGMRLGRRLRHSRNQIQFLVFSGGKDGCMSIVQVLLRHTHPWTLTDPSVSSSGAIYQCRTRLLQRFHLHQDQIQQIVLSPWSEVFQDHVVACVGADRRVTVFAPRAHGLLRSNSISNSSTETRSKTQVEWECILDLGEHEDDVIGLTWLLDAGGFLLVECDNNMTSVWNVETGLLERCLPSRLLDNNDPRCRCSRVSRANRSPFPIETSTIPVADTSFHLLRLSVHKTADHLKATWKTFYHALRTLEAMASAAKRHQDETIKAIQSQDVTDKDMLDVDAEVDSDEDPDRGSDGEGDDDQDGDEPSQEDRTSSTRETTSVSISTENDPSVHHLNASPYATGSIELAVFSFLLNWGSDKEVDRLCEKLLGISRPKWSFSGALLGASNALTIPIPWMSPNGSPHSQLWQHSAALTATIALSVVSLCMSMMEYRYLTSSTSSDQIVMAMVGHDKASSEPVMPLSPPHKQEFRSLWSRLVTQHSVYLPEHLVDYREASLEALAMYGFHRNEHTQLASHLLLNGVIMRLEPTMRSVVTAEYCAKLHFELARLESELGMKFSSAGTSIDPSLLVKRVGPLVILLSIIGTCFPGEISPAGAREVCDILVYLLRASSHVACVAAELLAKGLMLFRPHLVDLSSLICQLLMLEVYAKQQKNSGASSSPTASSRQQPRHGTSFNDELAASNRQRGNAALDLLVELGACEAAFVLTLLQQEINNADRTQTFRECVLVYLTELINTHYLLMFRHLPAVVDTVMCCLDPTKPERRKRCLELSTLCLHNLVRKFPMIDFHRDSQRLALGTMEAVILIYDLRTATKWRVLDGHTSAISALCFRTDGQILVSYAAREGSVRWWNSGSSGIFGGMLKMQQSCIKEQKLNVLKGDVASAGSAAASSSGGLTGAGAGAGAGASGAGFDLKQVIHTCRFQFLIYKEKVSQKEKTVLRLTREDASQVQFQL